METRVVRGQRVNFSKGIKRKLGAMVGASEISDGIL